MQPLAGLTDDEEPSPSQTPLLQLAKSKSWLLLIIELFLNLCLLPIT